MMVMAGTRKSFYIHGTREDEQDRLARLNELTNESFIDFTEVRDTDTILELGSGLGILAGKISEKLTTGKVTGIEISADQIAKCPKETKKLSFIRGDVCDLPFDQDSFDTVYCRYILEHVESPVRALHEARRVLKPGGRIFIQENSILLLEFYPDCPHFRLVWKAFAAYQSTLGGDAMIGIKLYALLKQAGFEKPELSMAPELHYPESGTFGPWIDNLIGNIRSAKDRLITENYITQRQYSAAEEELEELKNNKTASSYFYWNRAKALKPV